VTGYAGGQNQRMLSSLELQIRVNKYDILSVARRLSVEYKVHLKCWWLIRPPEAYPGFHWGVID